MKFAELGQSEKSGLVAIEGELEEDGDGEEIERSEKS